MGLTRRLGTRGLVRVDGVYRKYRDFYAFDLNTTTGTVSDQFGKVYDLGYTVNTNDVERTYKGLNFQVSYRAHDRLNLGGNYTLSNAYGNFNGETGPNGPVTIVDPDEPRVLRPAPGAGARSPAAISRRIGWRADRRPAHRRAPSGPRLGHLGHARSRRSPAGSASAGSRSTAAGRRTAPWASSTPGRT